jgi:hypothetical protein
VPVSALDIVKIAEAEVGVREVPMGSNTGPRVRDYQSSTSLAGTGWPWCAAFVEWVWERARLDEHPANPSTFWMCKRAESRGELSSTPMVGGAIIWCGTHVGLVVAVGSSTVRTIEGNSGDAVNPRTRAIAGAKFINPKGVVQGEIEPTRYWLEDVGATIEVFGPWRSRKLAARRFKSLKPETKRIASVVETGDGRFAIRIGRRFYGPWLTDAAQNNARRKLEAALGRTLREYRTGPKLDDGTAEQLGKTD